MEFIRVAAGHLAIFLFATHGQTTALNYSDLIISAFSSLELAISLLRLHPGFAAHRPSALTASVPPVRCLSIRDAPVAWCVTKHGASLRGILRHLALSFAPSAI